MPGYHHIGQVMISKKKLKNTSVHLDPFVFKIAARTCLMKIALA